MGLALVYFSVKINYRFFLNSNKNAGVNPGEEDMDPPYTKSDICAFELRTFYRPPGLKVAFECSKRAFRPHLG